MLGTLNTLGTERLEVMVEPIFWPNIVEPFVVWILRGCGAMWLQEAKSISQEEGDLPDKTKWEEEKNALPTIWMVLTIISWTMEMVIVDPEDLDIVEMGSISWILLVLATIAAEMEIADLLQW